MRVVSTLLVALNSGLLITVGVLYWPSAVPPTHNALQDSVDRRRVQELMAEGEWREAAELAKRYGSAMEQKSPEGLFWLGLFVDINEAKGNAQQLALLYEHEPSLFTKREKAALLVADQYIKSGQREAYSSLRADWKGNEEYPEAWLLLDADRLLLDGQRAGAIALLEGRTLEGKAEGGRLTRLGLLNVMADPKAAWSYFSKALDYDHDNIELRTYRAKLLEASGMIDAASDEYADAIEVDPKNLWLRNEAAEFCLRRRRFQEALTLWVGGLSAPSSESFWRKALFWNKVAAPAHFDWSQHLPPQGEDSSFISYLLNLGPKEFWNPRKFMQVSDREKILEGEPVAYWLQLLHALKHGREKEAIALIEYSPFQMTSWNPELEIALLRVLNYRQNGTFHLGGLEDAVKYARRKGSPEEPLFFQQLSKLAREEKPLLPPEIKALLESKDAFAVLFLEGNWPLAAHSLQSLQAIPTSFPPLYACKMTDALRQMKDNSAALAFATRHPATPELELTIAELLIAEKSPLAALEHLDPLTTRSDEIGRKAAELQVQLYIQRKEFALARQIIDKQPLLGESTRGRELIARIALLEGNEEGAAELYSAIEGESDDACAFLARYAFHRGDWRRAKELTEKLLTRHPDDLTLLDNLAKIKAHAGIFNDS